MIVTHGSLFLLLSTGYFKQQLLPRHLCVPYGDFLAACRHMPMTDEDGGKADEDKPRGRSVVQQLSKYVDPVLYHHCEEMRTERNLRLKTGRPHLRRRDLHPDSRRPRRNSTRGLSPHGIASSASFATATHSSTTWIDGYWDFSNVLPVTPTIRGFRNWRASNPRNNDV